MSTAQTQGQNILIVHDVTGYADSTIVIMVEPQTNDNFFAIQFDLLLPAGFSYIPNSAYLIPSPLPPHPAYMINAEVIPGTNTLRVMTFSLSNLFTNGLMVSFGAETPSQTGVYPLNLENGIIGGVSGQNLLTGSVNGMATIIPSFTIIPGDANSDGFVNVIDVLTIINYILGNNPQPFCFENADINGDGVVNAIDVIGTINIIQSGGFVCGVSTLTDIDGNIYNTVQIGNQCWMKENLKTTKYRNDTPIEYPGSNNSAWQVNTIGAYAWIYNEISLKDSYGALYNWHAVNNTYGLCPTGWHVPSDAEFTDLTDYLGGENVAGGKMKSTRTVPDLHPRWEIPNTGATNESNWSGLPGGNRVTAGSFNGISAIGYWWSSTESLTSSAWYRGLYYTNSDVGRSYFTKSYGFSVRCIKD